MVQLEKQHNPVPNAKLLSQLDENARLTEEAINGNIKALNSHKEAKTAHTSEQIDHGGFTVANRLNNFSARFANLVVNHDGKDVKEVVDARVTTDGKIAQTLKDRLDLEFNKLEQKIKREVYVDDFGAVPDGETDSTEAFRKAVGDGNVRVHLSAGTYVVRGVKLPSWTYLIGQGKGVTTLKLHEDTPASEWVITNTDYKNGNRNIFVQGMSLDWNPERQGGVGATGGQHSSCLTYAKVKFGWVKDVEAINAGLHGIDITSPTYDHLPDTDWTKDGSKYIWVDNCVAYGAGDDGITTHYSEYVFISNSHSVNQRGTAHPKGQSNSNGIEVDDGSKNVWLINNYTSGNIRGVEVKAHTEWPASQNVHVIGHVSYRDVRSFDLRHIGHHKAADPESTTAYDVTLTDCTAIEPVFNDMYAGLSPRALVVSAYKNVQINGFTAIGDPNYDYKNNPAIAFQYKCRNITVNGIKIRGFKKAGMDIHVIGGDQKSDHVKISNIDIRESAPQAIGLGGGVYNVSLISGSLIGSNGTYGITSPNNQALIFGITAEGYEVPAMLANNKYPFVPTNIPGGFKAAAASSVVLDESSAIVGATGANIAKGPRNFMGGVSGGSSTEGSRQAIIASNNSHTKGDGPARVVMASQAVVNDDSYSVGGGYGNGSPSKDNIKWKIGSTNGNIQGVGRVESVSDFKDLAEYFESKDGRKIESGYLVTLDGDKIRKAEKGDRVLGVISETAGVVMGGAAFYWNDRYLRNEFGGMIYETIIDDSGRKLKIPKENPNYIPDLEYIPREERDEWHVVGLIGQVYVRIDETIQAGDRIVPVGGIGTKSEDGAGFYVMRIKQPYSLQKGYGLAQIFIHPQM
ncbi:MULTISPECIES: peptidase G2 autoproteolytic cleavage domain-containing protein [Bacillus]|uniref:Peptidase G2 n=1 Tax=Bacillus glycinifermentans TaxID=1664069 RepID=A0AAJ3Z191_9BACI|nr:MULTISPECIES: peptidase G2 autoproteolytic cleavage domain-containing protein [Bacillus]KKB75353.1 peptidase G2 [Bacillus sp. TH008]MDU0070659.1 peptidase G2 autoproteolytic cleavage domain-containing protein [Bacillus sp. IG6]MED8018523.1 peptidase G2 autoproteolytic cleavage domain-containing protein [Bacillus glycinifermentans]QAT66977.1 peptidase G2 [Bacillus glycinifermentans]WKB76689.1 peptidase G2 autoproteolytic cleavage domain-containing protein [Bacillus glycinifermentans]